MACEVIDGGNFNSPFPSRSSSSSRRRLISRVGSSRALTSVDCRPKPHQIHQKRHFQGAAQNLEQQEYVQFSSLVLSVYNFCANFEMGNQNCCSTRQKGKAELLDKNELMAVVEFLEYHANLFEETRNKKVLDYRAFTKIFCDFPQFGTKVFQFVSARIGNEGQIPFEPLISILETFLQSKQSVGITVFSAFEMLLLVHIEQSKVESKSIKELERIPVTADQAYSMMTLILMMFVQQQQKRSAQVDSRPLVALIDALYGGTETMPYPQLVDQVQSQLPYVNLLIKAYFCQRFLQKPFNTLKIPRMMKDSCIVGRDWIALLALSSKEFHQNDSMNLRYSSVNEGLSFERFGAALLESGSSSLVVAAFESQADAYSKRETFSFAGFNSIEWIADENEQAFANTQLVYQLLPELRVLNNEMLKKRNFKNIGCSNYFYYHPQAQPDYYGFGMGKDALSGRYLFWLDPDLQGGSYCSPQMAKQLPQRQMELKFLEVWGLELVQNYVKKERNSYKQRNSLQRNSNIGNRQGYQPPSEPSQQQLLTQPQSPYGHQAPQFPTGQQYQSMPQQPVTHQYPAPQLQYPAQQAQPQYASQYPLLTTQLSTPQEPFLPSPIYVPPVPEFGGSSYQQEPPKFGAFEPIVKEASPQFNRYENPPIPQFNNPQPIRSTSQTRYPAEKDDRDRLSQSIINKYANRDNHHRASSNTPAVRLQDSRKSVDDIMRRYEK